MAHMTWPQARRAAGLEQIDSGAPGYAIAFRKALSLAGIPANSPAALRAALGGDPNPEATYQDRYARNLAQTNQARAQEDVERHDLAARFAARADAEGKDAGALIAQARGRNVAKADTLDLTGLDFSTALRRLLAATGPSAPVNSQPHAVSVPASYSPARELMTVNKSAPAEKSTLERIAALVRDMV